MVKGSFNSLSSYEDLEEVKAFFKDKDVRKFRLAVSQTFDSIQANADWLARDKEDVSQVRTGFFRCWGVASSFIELRAAGACSSVCVY